MGFPRYAGDASGCGADLQSMVCSPSQKAAVGCRLRWTVRRRGPENGGRAPRVSSARGAMSQRSPSPGKVVTVEVSRARQRQTPGLGPTVAEGRVPGKEREKPSPAGHRVECQRCQAQRSCFAWGGVWQAVAAAVKGCGAAVYRQAVAASLPGFG